MNTSNPGVPDAPLVLAHDLGTTGDKATLVAADGTLVGSVTVAYPVDFGADGKAEQDPDDWWRAFCEANHRLLGLHGLDPSRIGAVSFSGQMMGAVLIDGRGRPVRPGIIWADTRARAQCDQLVERVGMDEVYRMTGHRANPTYSLSKLMWVRDTEPEAFARAERFLTAKDVILHRLTGRCVTDPSDASGTNAYDQDAQGWSGELIEAAGLDRALFPEIVESSADLGGVRPEVAAESGLSPATRVIAGGGDGPMGALGAGIVDRSSGVYTYLGSSSWVSFADTRPLHDPLMRSMTFNHVIPGHFVPTATMQAGGASLDWIVSVLRPGADDRFEAALADAERAEASADGLYFLPHLLGERSPYWNPRARAAFVGLQMPHDRANMVRAVIEGVAFNLRTGLVAFAEAGHSFERIDAIGGAAKSPLVGRILADTWQLSVVPSSIGDHATSLGAAAVAALGVGLIRQEEVPEFVGKAAGPGIEPRLDAAENDRRYALFMDAYRRLEGWFDEL
ncbi:xylulokinase [Leucobacter sp. CSA1]|uniref:Xylulose kinase n=1 Tax=Leucobacter chromiisoli TaxID=2796471 RepID=A0A934Q7A1_9MICO|nr:xylulokinase [Leucobacter chromiisoli]MBK0418381.1 xylulokinase [Leucobacter chromiisoli]